MNSPTGYLADVETYKIQVLAILGSTALLVFILYLIRNKKIQEGYSILWLGISLVFLFFSIWREALDYISFAVGIAYPPAAVFLILLMAIFMILIQFSMILSRHSENAKNMAQEYAILRMEMESMKKVLVNLQRLRPKSGQIKKNQEELSNEDPFHP